MNKEEADQLWTAVRREAEASSAMDDPEEENIDIGELIDSLMGFGVAESAAEDELYSLLDQLGHANGRELDPDDLSPDAAAFIYQHAFAFLVDGPKEDEATSPHQPLKEN